MFCGHCSYKIDDRYTSYVWYLWNSDVYILEIASWSSRDDSAHLDTSEDTWGCRLLNICLKIDFIICLKQQVWVMSSESALPWHVSLREGFILEKSAKVKKAFKKISWKIWFLKRFIVHHSEGMQEKQNVSPK